MMLASVVAASPMVAAWLLLLLLLLQWCSGPSWSFEAVLVAGGGDSAVMLSWANLKRWQQMAVKMERAMDRGETAVGNVGATADGGDRAVGADAAAEAMDEAKGMMSVGEPEAMGAAEGKARVAEVTEVGGKAEISKVTMGEHGGEAAAVMIVGKAGTATGGATEGVRGEAKAEAGRTEDAGAMAMGIDVVVEVSEAETAAGEAGAGAGAGAIGVGGAMTGVDETEVAVMMTVGDGEMAAEAGDVGTVTVMEDEAGNGEGETEDRDWDIKRWVQGMIPACSWFLPVCTCPWIKPPDLCMPRTEKPWPKLSQARFDGFGSAWDLRKPEPPQAEP
ncbi:hypothetical protein F5148DRAFT_1147737 [Russula earlei]|uniref:Uncharacterized protein n=1 Tax=Russula earlei TaxID=71964 RepID=A0ACC0UF27_9AGAM|nr:hypothetical protein F5148DRAFT_1147737 [Russula earlei]